MLCSHRERQTTKRKKETVNCIVYRNGKHAEDKHMGQEGRKVSGLWEDGGCSGVSSGSNEMTSERNWTREWGRHVADGRWA